MQQKFPHEPIFSISFHFHFPLDIQLEPQNNIQQLIINQTPHCQHVSGKLCGAKGRSGQREELHLEVLQVSAGRWRL